VGTKQVTILADSRVFNQALDISRIVYPSEFEKLTTNYGVRIVPVSLVPFKLEVFKAFSARAAETKHSSRSFGLRIELSNPKTVIAYSGDTEPCENMMKLAEGADWLIHDSFTPHKLKGFANSIGHSTALQAAIIAKRSKAKRLILLNQWYNVSSELEPLKAEAESVFSGEVLTVRDSTKISL
jgi:ribonuclease BN (tRNA processing enzyme)